MWQLIGYWKVIKRVLNNFLINFDRRDIRISYNVWVFIYRDDPNHDGMRLAEIYASKVKVNLVYRYKSHVLICISRHKGSGILNDSRAGLVESLSLSHFCSKRFLKIKYHFDVSLLTIAR